MEIGRLGDVITRSRLIDVAIWPGRAGISRLRSPWQLRFRAKRCFQGEGRKIEQQAQDNTVSHHDHGGYVNIQTVVHCFYPVGKGVFNLLVRYAHRPDFFKPMDRPNYFVSRRLL
jgi:hypothetical protein